MPSPRVRTGPGDPIRAPGRVTLEMRPADATGDFGDRDRAGYIPGVTGRRAQSRKANERPRAVRNGLPVRAYRYSGEGHDWLTGRCQCGLPGCEWQGKGTAGNA